MSVTLGELATQFGCEIVGDPGIVVDSVASLESASAGSISFFVNPAYGEALSRTSASAVILQQQHVGQCNTNALISDNAYLTYARVAAVLYPARQHDPGIHTSATVSPVAQVADSAHVCAGAFVDDEAIVGEHCFVGPGAVIGARCRLGEATRVFARAVLVQDVCLGRRCIIHPGAVLGADGFGNAMSAEGWVKVPQVGGVQVGDDVEIGSNTTVDRGAIGDTIIGNGVRLDNQIQIAHNVVIGDHTAMAAQTGIAGSAIIGKRCMFAGRAGSVGHVTICDDVIVSASTYVSKDIREPGVYTGSFPAEKDKSWKRNAARFRRLDAMVKRINALEKKRKS